MNILYLHLSKTDRQGHNDEKQHIPITSDEMYVNYFTFQLFDSVSKPTPSTHSSNCVAQSFYEGSPGCTSGSYSCPLLLFIYLFTNIFNYIN